MSHRRDRILDEDESEDFLMIQAIFYHPIEVEKDETGGNTSINCWKNYAIKASFIQDFA